MQLLLKKDIPIAFFYLLAFYKYSDMSNMYFHNVSKKS